jgi:hypothetical protein
VFYSLIISPLFVPSIFHSHPLLSVSYYRKLNCNNTLTCILVLTCTAVHCAWYVYSSLKVSNGIMSHPPSGSSVTSSHITHMVWVTDCGVKHVW